MKLTYTDSNHAYYLDGKRAKSASKVAGIASDSFTVEQWGKRMVAIGMTLDATLREDVAVDLDNKTAIQEVCDKASAAAKAHARANRGTQRHRVFELVLLDRQNEFITDQQRADAEVLRRTLDAYGLEPIPAFVEQFVAYPEQLVCGRFDCLLGHEGRPVITDLKGGPNAVKYPHSTLTQLPLYRFAPHVSAGYQRDGDRTVVTEWTTFPDGTDEDIAYIIYCDDDHDVGELWRLDLHHGRQGAELALSIVEWRKRHNKGKDAVRRHDEKVTEMAARRMAADAERTPPAVKPTIDEGGAADQGDINTAKARYEVGMDAEQKAWTGQCVQQAIEAGHDFRVTQKATQRRADLYCGLTKLITSDYWGKGFDDIVRAIVYATVDDEQVLGALPIGPFVGQLDAAQASTFRQHVDQLVDGHTVLVADATGKLQPKAAA